MQHNSIVLNDAQVSSLPSGLEPYDYFPSEESTKFGDWVKAGALKAGDQLSIHDGVDEVSGDKTLTVVSNTRDNTPTRVYNLEIESRPGEITHNYFVGEDGVLVHNANGKCFTPDQQALVDLAKQANRRGGVTWKEAGILVGWGLEVGFTPENCRGPECHPNRPFGKFPHIHIGPINHIPVK